MVAVIDSPDFMFIDIDLSKVGKIKKLIYFLKGIFVGFIFSRTNKKLFCFIINLLFPQEDKITYSNNFYSKNIDGLKINYPNKRIVRVVKNYKIFLDNLFESYCLNSINFKKGDVIVDCGSNIGEIYYSLIQKKLEVAYYAFEPDPSAYKCLVNNLNNQKNVNLHPIALSNSESESELYIDGFGGNSSLEYFGSKQKVTTLTKKLDSFNLKKIKLFKVEAEGHEEEVLKGSIQTFPYIEYITVDYGPEKGESQESTMTSVINYLSDNGFELIQTSKYRQIGLFKNKKLIDNSQ
jgi:FkbM family methyltransferase